MNLLFGNCQIGIGMKKNDLALLVLMLASFGAFAQRKLPVIKASSKNATIIEGTEDRINWGLSPDARPDVYTFKSPETKRVKFRTDIDSIEIKLKPGRQFDFVVLLNGKDSCFTRIESDPLKDYSALKPEIHDTIPFVLTAFNNIVVKAILDGKDTLNVKFDSGTTDFLLTRDAIRNDLHLENLDGHTFQIGGQKWEKQTIYPVELSGQGTAGRFGWNLFEGKIVEIDYDRSRFIVHSRLPRRRRDYAQFKMEYSHTLFCIQGELQIKDRKYRNRFLFDSGYQRTVMLDEDLVREQHYPKDSLEVIRKVVMQNGQGKEIPVLTVNNERLNLGKYALTNIPVQLLSSNNPAGFKTHILGNEVLKRFNTVLDFQKNMVYLKPNGLLDLPYSEQKKGGT